jgi:hypothetical protein
MRTFEAPITRIVARLCFASRAEPASVRVSVFHCGHCPLHFATPASRRRASNGRAARRARRVEEDDAKEDEGRSEAITFFARRRTTSDVRENSRGRPFFFFEPHLLRAAFFEQEARALICNWCISDRYQL